MNKTKVSQFQGKSISMQNIKQVVEEKKNEEKVRQLLFLRQETCDILYLLIVVSPNVSCLQFKILKPTSVYHFFQKTRQPRKMAMPTVKEVNYLLVIIFIHTSKNEIEQCKKPITISL